MPAPSNLTTRLAYSQCRPNKAGRRTLETSGSMLGLAPAKSLVQMDATNILQQLAQSKGISEPVWSLTLLDGESGVLSIGGTIAEEVLRAEHETENALNALGQIEQMASKGEAAPEKEGTELDAEQLADLSKVDSGTTLKKRSIDAEELTSPPVQQKARLTKRTNLKSTRQESWRDLFMWTKVQGAQGWWQILMNGVWVEGVRVLKNQPVIIDVRAFPGHHLRFAAATCYQSCRINPFVGALQTACIDYHRKTLYLPAR